MGNAFLVCSKGDGEKKTKKCKDKKMDVAQSDSLSWEKKILNNIPPSEYKHTQAAIFNLKEHALLSSVPEDFIPDTMVMDDVLAYLNGDSCRLGVGRVLTVIKDSKRNFTVERIEEGETKAIHCTDGKKGGCSMIRADKFLLVMSYDRDVDKGLKLAADLAGRIEERTE